MHLRKSQSLENRCLLVELYAWHFDVSEGPWRQHHTLIFPTSGLFGANQCVWKVGKEGSGERQKGGLMTAVSVDKNTSDPWREARWLSPKPPGQKGQRCGCITGLLKGVAKVRLWFCDREYMTGESVPVCCVRLSGESRAAPQARQANHSAKRLGSPFLLGTVSGVGGHCHRKDTISQ